MPKDLRAFPESVVGGFSRRDGTVQFYSRVNALLEPDWVVADVGAGRGEWLADSVSYRRQLRNLRGKVSKVIGLDIDPIVAENASCDETIVMPGLAQIPLADCAVDLILCDHTFEHVDSPEVWIKELNRILRPGGWICARTPNRWGYIGVATNLVPNRFHVGVLRRAQPDRKEVDVFPTCYLLNTRRAVRSQFPAASWQVTIYGDNPEPAYFGRNVHVLRAVDAFTSRMPKPLSATWSIFIRKRTS